MLRSIGFNLSIKEVGISRLAKRRFTFEASTYYELAMARAGRPNKKDLRFDDVDLLIRQQDNEGVKKILLKTSLEATDGYLRTTLLLAALRKNAELLGWLIENWVNVSHQDRNGYSALHFAAQEKTQAVAKLLLDSGANLNALNKYQRLHGS